MSLLGRFINRYRVFWTIVLVLFGAFVYWMLFVKPSSPIYTEVDSELVRNDAIQDKPDPRRQLKQRIESLNLDVNEAEFSLSSQDGSLIMRVWADEVHKVGETYSINNGAMQFMLENRSSLLLSLPECTVNDEQGIVEVGGRMIGQIGGTNQFFTAEALVWSRDEVTIRVRLVSYIGPHIEVFGEQMVIILPVDEADTVKINFEGPVEARI